jgi:hypothetical protein
MLIAYNKTTSAKPIVAGNITLTTVPASGSASVRGKAWDVTAALQPNATVDPINGVTSDRLLNILRWVVTPIALASITGYFQSRAERTA